MPLRTANQARAHFARLLSDSERSNIFRRNREQVALAGFRDHHLIVQLDRLHIGNHQRLAAQAGVESNVLLLRDDNRAVLLGSMAVLA